MANINQFYKGEAIQITVADDEGNALVGEYNYLGSKGTYDGSTYKYAGLMAYPDNLDLDNGSSDKIKPFKVESSGDGAGKVFHISGSVSKTMDEGQYTLELVYGKNDDSRIIVKTNNAFIIIGSAFKRQNQ